ncbi:hypothetical protein C2E20_0293 [Micractinium conductrix]|uniref:GATA-type domain-containing protein n=1 Tax=Micractinium conductrix TaxID=554055 RepID=A0A2P6VRB4_9CHLO|nr:hypothetical protein C2E20_0293 [Micractinium conductrix]|eukprot:PSC76639.1 hypothetical protein C2E20_0293 [Micractinium conductrix]
MGTEMAAPPPSTALGDAPFDIQRSPFEAFPAGFDDAAALQAAILAATQPVAGAKRQRPDGGDTAAAEPAAPTPPRVGAGKHRPPRPPVLALPDSGSLESQALTPGRCGPSPRLAARSPRSPTGGASPGSRRAGKPLSKTQGRVCIECAATTTTQWRSQGLLCNSCGVKLIKGRLPMDADSMHRRFQRLPLAIREHPMWAAAQVVAAAQGAAAAAAAAGRPWACPGCNCVGEEKVAGPCGMQQCPPCVARYQPGGAVAIAAAVAAPPGTLTPTPSPTPAVGSASGHKRRKQATPRSAPPAGGLSPLSLSSSGSSSIWQGARDVEGADDATSKDPPLQGRLSARRLQQLRQGVRGGATPPSTSGRPPYDTPTAAEAAAALLVLTESDEARLAAAVQLEVPAPQAALPLQTAATMLPMAAAAAAAAAAELKGEALSEEPAVGPRGPPVTPNKEAAAGCSAGEAKPSAARPLHLQLAAAGIGAGGAGPSGASGASTAVDSMRLYSTLIAASAEPEAAAAGLTAALVGCYLAAHTMPGGAAGGDGAAAASAVRQEQQAQLVGLMLGQRQYSAAVGLMQGVIKLAGLSA